jgi:hypothetical protein
LKDDLAHRLILIERIKKDAQMIPNPSDDLDTASLNDLEYWEKRIRQKRQEKITNLIYIIGALVWVVI